jgi:LmbE family N-acetylglucosaminyl deacetylase
MPADEDLAQQFCEASQSKHGPSTLSLAAHPDDEVIGAAGRFRYLSQLTFGHVTDGSPRDLRDAAAAGFRTREEYALARRSEFHTALDIAELRSARTVHLGIVDQEAALDLPGLTKRILALLSEVRPEILLTHPYEGGHPDHDATCLASHLACTLLARQGITTPLIVEFTSYHSCDGQWRTGCFLQGQPPGIAVRLSSEEVKLKQRMLACFVTQQETLHRFQTEIERFRPAPLYNFSKPPHAGRLLYEHFGWGMTSARWTALARRAMEWAGVNVCV